MEEMKQKIDQTHQAIDQTLKAIMAKFDENKSSDKAAAQEWTWLDK